MRLFARLAALASGVALAFVIAWWGWQLLGPPAVRVPPATPANPAATIIAANLFGSASSQPSPKAVPDAALAGDTKLLGIIAEAGDRGYALFRLPSGAKLVAQGGEIANGVTLVSVQRDGVTIRDGAGERRYVLRADAPSAARGSANAAVSGARAQALTASVRASATCAPPAGFRGTVVRLNAELLGGVGADSVQWPTLLMPSAGGLVVRSDNGFGAMLGLKTGDRLTQANGIALSAPDDVATAIVKPLVANQGVRLIGARDGATQELWLANAACAG